MCLSIYVYVCIYMPRTNTNQHICLYRCVYIHINCQTIVLVILPIILSMRRAFSHLLAQNLAFFPALGSVLHGNQPNMHRLCHHSHPLATPWIKMCTRQQCGLPLENELREED